MSRGETSHNEQPEEAIEIKPEELKQEYNFEVMRDLEGMMDSLVDKLKDKIESGEYGILLSDDAGGRIPTLVLREILKEKGPKADIKTYFLAAGLNTPEKPLKSSDSEVRVKTMRMEWNERGYSALQKYLKGFDFRNKKILIVTQYVESGDTLKKIGSALNDINVESFDFATVGINKENKEGQTGKLKHELFSLFGSSFYFGDEIFEESHESITLRHSDFSGITRGSLAEPYDPSPQKKFGSEDIIIKSRQDVDLMAKRVIEQVWGKEEK